MQPKKVTGSGTESLRSGGISKCKHLEMSIAEQERLALNMLSRRV